MLVRVVEREVLGHPVVEVLGLDGLLVLVQPVHGIPPSLAFVRRHDVVGLADVAGDVILGPGYWLRPGNSCRRDTSGRHSQ